VTELAYALDHPAHPANKGKKFSTPPTPFSHDYMPEHPARGGQGQAVPQMAGDEGPRDGFRHLTGLTGATLREAEKAFAALPKKEQAARLAGEYDSIPATPEEGA
jgi:hypothetical protein